MLAAVIGVLVIAYLLIQVLSTLVTTLHAVADSPGVAALYVGGLVLLTSVPLVYLLGRSLARWRSARPAKKRPVPRQKLQQIDRALRDYPTSSAALRVTVCGSPGVGKTSLVQQLRRLYPGLTCAELKSLSTDSTQNKNVLEQAADSHLVLFVIANDIVTHEYEALTELHRLQARTVVVFNKSDLFARQALREVERHIADRLQGILAADDLVTVCADPQPAQRVRVNKDGSTEDIEVAREPDLQELETRLRAYHLMPVAKTVPESV